LHAPLLNRGWQRVYFRRPVASSCSLAKLVPGLYVGEQETLALERPFQPGPAGVTDRAAAPVGAR
jgi:hypothetical protein